MRPIIVVLYFCTGFFVGSVFAMLMAMLLRSAILNAGDTGRIFAAFSPLLLGVFGGVRTAVYGRKHKLPLGAALRKAFLLK